MFDARSLDKLSIPKPCEASWGGMSGDNKERFCISCNRVVHDFSNLTRREAAALLRNSGGRLCAKISYDSNGRVKFRREPDCRPVSRIVGISLLGISSFASESISFAQEPAKQQIVADTSKTCNLSVRVVDPTSTSIPGAQVSLTPKDDPRIITQGTTNSDGLFRNILPPGEYQLYVTSAGFRSYMQNLNLSCNVQSTTIPVDVSLQLGSTMGSVVFVTDSHLSPLRRIWSRAQSALWRLFHS